MANSRKLGQIIILYTMHSLPLAWLRQFNASAGLEQTNQRANGTIRQRRAQPISINPLWYSQLSSTWPRGPGFLSQNKIRSDFFLELLRALPMAVIGQDALHVPGKRKAVLQVVALYCHGRNDHLTYL